MSPALASARPHVERFCSGLPGGQTAFAADVAAMDKTAAALLRERGAAAAVAALTQFTTDTDDRLVDNWNTFFGELFVRFSDGFDAAPIPRPPPVSGAPSCTYC